MVDERWFEEGQGEIEGDVVKTRKGKRKYEKIRRNCKRKMQAKEEVV